MQMVVADLAAHDGSRRRERPRRTTTSGPRCYVTFTTWPARFTAKSPTGSPASGSPGCRPRSPTIPAQPGPADAVTLCSFHRAKGLEWQAVWVAGLEHGLVPIGRARSDAAEAEERRLLYVALTRAAVELHCSWARQRTFGTRPVPRDPRPGSSCSAPSPPPRQGRGPVRGRGRAPTGGEPGCAINAGSYGGRPRGAPDQADRPDRGPTPDPDLVGRPASLAVRGRAGRQAFRRTWCCTTPRSRPWLRARAPYRGRVAARARTGAGQGRPVWPDPPLPGVRAGSCGLKPGLCRRGCGRQAVAEAGAGRVGVEMGDTPAAGRRPV